MHVTPKMIIRDIRDELKLTRPDARAIGLKVAEALELIDARIDNVEQSADPTFEIRHAEEPPVRARKRK